MRGLRRLLGALGQRARKLVAVLRDDGLVESVVLVRGYVEYRREKLFGARVDRTYGSETSGRIPLDRLEIDSPNVAEGVQYEPVSELYFRRMLGALRIPPDTYVFVDLGSGKGRALVMAAEWPFKRFVGIDFSPERVAARGPARRPRLLQEPASPAGVRARTVPPPGEGDVSVRRLREPTGPGRPGRGRPRYIAHDPLRTRPPLLS
jgi:hypothetical protein